MAVMSMNNAIHGAVRRDLQRFDNALATFDEGDKARASALGAAWDNFDQQLTIHHEGEHQIAWPALEQVGVSKELLATLDAEHDTMAAALQNARAVFTGFRASGTGATAVGAAIADLRTVTLAHLDHEEAELEPVFQANLDAPAIKEMGRKFGKVSPTVGGTFFAWVTDGASPDEMAGITGSVPKPVLTIIGGIFGRGYRKTVAPVWRG